jgi:AICAR transformylase/IMP cyclohydrolase PurH
MDLRYGINPGQVATASVGGDKSPVRLVSGEPSYINLLDALNAWQLVREAAAVLGRPVATSFKHVSPAGAAAAGQIDAVMEETWGISGNDLTPGASAYIRARDCDPKSSYGDFVAVSEPVDQCLAKVLTSVVSDGIVAPGYETSTVEMLAAKKGGRYLVIEADPGYEPPDWEARELFGVRFEQRTPRPAVNREILFAGTSEPLPDEAVADLLLAMITARYTQSNCMVYAKAGMVLGAGAGQQSRIDCTKIAGTKVDSWWLRRHDKARSVHFKPGVPRQERINHQVRHIEGEMSADERSRFLDAVVAEPLPFTSEDRTRWLNELDHVALASDGYIPFRDNIDQAARHGVRYLAHPGGSARNDEVVAASIEHGITMVSTGIRLFHH